MNQLEYIPGIGGQSVQMDGPESFVGIAENLRSREWSYNLGYRDIVSATRPAREIDTTFHADYATADQLRRVADADVMSATPGIFLAQNEWRQRGYILASQPNDIHYGRLSTELKIALLDGAWWRLVTKSFIPTGEESIDGEYLDFPHDYEHDYGNPGAAPYVESSTLTPSDVRIIVYGPATNPSIAVGGNTYQVNVTVPSGGYLIVDGREKTITLILANGTAQNAFPYGVRGSGQGSGTYIFEPLQPGSQEVTFSGDFGFDFGWYEEEGEPPWNQS